MNLDYIRTFVILGQSRSMTQASQKLNVTASYVSRHIHQLEEELETKLIIYSSKNRDLELTEAGKYFFEKYEKIYNEFLLTEKNFKQNKEINNYKIRIGINADLDVSFLQKN
jgi:DNA-binding transcriptional LysR family regulator